MTRFQTTCPKKSCGVPPCTLTVANMGQTPTEVFLELIRGPLRSLKVANANHMANVSKKPPLRVWMLSGLRVLV